VRQPALRLSLAVAIAAAALPAVPAEAAPAVYRGKLEIRHSDYFAGGRAHTSYRLVRGRHRTRLVLKRAPHVPSGSAVVVRGRRSGSRIRGTLRPRGIAHAARVAAGPRKTAVVLINFTTDRSTPFSTDDARQVVFTAPTSVNAFYTDESYGAVSLVGELHSDGDVFGWYELDASGEGCPVETWASKARAAAAEDGFVRTNYDHVVYVFPEQSSCGGWTGLGEIPGGQSWINGSLSTRVIAHELGHNMGLHHASSLSCTSGGAPVTFSSTCTPDEYGDPFDVMGKKLRHNNAWHMRQTGFMPAGNERTVSADGTYTLTSAIARGSGAQLLRVPRGDTGLYYDLELRSSGGVFEDYLSTDPAVQGVTVHLDPDVEEITQSFLLDTTPGSSSGTADAALAAGRTFTDGDLSISVLSVSGTTAKVSVATAPPPDTTPPSAPPPEPTVPPPGTPPADNTAPTARVDSPAPGARLRREAVIRASAADGTGVVRTELWVDGQLRKTATKAQVAWRWVLRRTRPGRHRVAVRAFDAAGNRGSGAVHVFVIR
jgi:Big-like domain-containing protein/gametolysin peptidase M11